MASPLREKRTWPPREKDADSAESAAFEATVAVVKETVVRSGEVLVSAKRVGHALLEATLDCAPCQFIEDKRPGLREAMRGKRGTLFRVLESGEIKVGDEIQVLG